MGKDTLHVDFSEIIKADITESPFDLKHSNGSTYSLQLTHNSINKLTHSYVVEKIIGTEYPKDEDSIHISLLSGIQDEKSIQQTNSNNRWVMLNRSNRPYKLVIKAISPVNPDTYDIPEELISSKYSVINGVVIVGDFNVNIEETDNVEASITIFDKLGNRVNHVDNLQSGSRALFGDIINDTTSKVVFYWNGRNKNSRRVATGSYLAVVSIKGPNNDVSVSRLLLGVK